MDGRFNIDNRHLTRSNCAEISVKNIHNNAYFQEGGDGEGEGEREGEREEGEGGGEGERSAKTRAVEPCTPPVRPLPYQKSHKNPPKKRKKRRGKNHHQTTGKTCKVTKEITRDRSSIRVQTYSFRVVPPSFPPKIDQHAFSTKLSKPETPDPRKTLYNSHDRAPGRSIGF